MTMAQYGYAGSEGIQPATKWSQAKKQTLKTFQANLVAIEGPKVSTLVTTTLPAYKEAGELGPGISPMIPTYAPTEMQVLQAASPHLMIARAVFGTASRLPWIKKFLPKVGLGVKKHPVGAAIPTKEVVKAVAGTAVTALTVKEVVDVIGPTAAGIATEAVKIGVDIYKDLSGYELGPGGNGMAHPQAGTSIAIRPSGPTGMGIMPGGDQIVKTWHANGIPFWRTQDGWIYVQRKDGTVKRYRPYKSVVLGKRPSSKQINRAINKLKREDKTYHKLTRLFHKPTRSKSAH